MRHTYPALLLALVFAAHASAQTPPPVDIEWTWSPEPRWLTSALPRANAPTPDIGLSFGHDSYGSTVRRDAVPPIRIVFDDEMESVVRVFNRADQFRDAGAGRFRGAAYDLSDPAAPRRLNVGLVEDSRMNTFDHDWAPSPAESTGQDVLLVFASDYDGGGAYEGRTARQLDTFYGLAAREAPGRGIYSTDATLLVTPSPLRDVTAIGTLDGAATVRWTASDRAAEVIVRILGLAVGRAAPEAGGVLLTGLDPGVPHALSVEAVDAYGVVLEARRALARPATAGGIAAASVLPPSPIGYYGDVWGYTASDGTEYALLTNRWEGLYILDVSGAPAAVPEVVGFVASVEGANDSKDVKVYGHYAYLAHEGGPVQIIDLVDPSAPVTVGTLDVQPGVFGSGAHNLLVAQDHLWVVGGRTSGNAGVRVFSLADPAAPVWVGEFRPDHQPVAYYHDFEVRGDRAYGSAIYNGGGVDVLDVSDPSDIRLVTTFTYPGAGAHNTCSSEDGRTVYVGDEIGENGNWMRIFDVSEIEDAELVGEIIVDPQAVVHNCVVQGDRLFVAHYTEGLRVFDISAPHEPIEIAFLDTDPGLLYGFNGAWTAYPFPGSGKIIVSDLETGLWVATLAEPETGPAPGDVPTLSAGPNPTVGGLRLTYNLEAEAQVRLSLVDLLGREVAVMQDATESAGPHRPVFNVSGLPAGLYVAVLTVDGVRRATTTLTVVR